MKDDSRAPQVSAARSIVATLPELLARPDRPELRERLATAALQAGLAFSNTRTALAHSLSYDTAPGIEEGRNAGTCYPAPRRVLASRTRRAFGNPVSLRTGPIATSVGLQM